jgi:hypothetical protein
MADGDLRDQIARLEAEIEELAKTLEGCRKAMLLSKVAIAAGGIWLLAYFFMRVDPTTMIGAIASLVLWHRRRCWILARSAGWQTTSFFEGNADVGWIQRR